MDVFNLIKENLKKVLGNSDQAYLFGSRARGTAHNDSDWDILIILNKDGKLRTLDYDRYSYPLVTLGWDINQVINPILYTHKEWISQKFTPFYKNIQREGIKII